MKKCLIGMLFSLLMAGVTQAQVSDPNSYITGWALMGITPELSKMQEVRVGYKFGVKWLFSDLEVAGGFLHLDGPDPGVQEWGGRVYLLAHALNAKMFTQMLGSNLTLPEGNLYGGFFGQYTYDRDNEWSGGWVVGGLVDFPAKWQTVVEYSTNVWNNDNDSYAVVFGLRRQFGK